MFSNTIKFKRKHQDKNKRKGVNRRNGAMRHKTQKKRRIQTGGEYNMNDALCSLALSDTLHDFKDNNMVFAAKFTLPVVNAKEMCKPVYENDYLEEFLGIERESVRPGALKFKADSFPSELTDEYDYYYIAKTSHLHQLFAANNLNENYLVVDTYSPAFAHEIGSTDEYVDTFKKNNLTPSLNDLKFYWVQNKQTIFDPAGKTHEKTQRGKELFFHKNKRGELIHNNHTVHCWETGHNIDVYPKYKMGDEFDGNNMFYSKYDVYQVLYNPNTDLYSKQDVKCALKTEDNKLITFDGKMAAIASFNAIKASYNGFAAIKNTLDEYINDFVKKGTFEKRHHCLAKRLGDQGQALSCLKESMTLKHTNPTTGEIVKHTSNGNHTFVTIDKLAMAGALLYKVPIVIYCFKHSAFGVFINKRLMDPAIIIEQLKDKYVKELFPQYKALKLKYNGKRKNNGKGKKYDYNDILNDFENKISEILTMNVNDEKSYRTFIKEMMNIAYISNFISKKNINEIEDIEFPANLDNAAYNSLANVKDIVSRLRLAINNYEMCNNTIDLIVEKYSTNIDNVNIDKANIDIIEKSELFLNSAIVSVKTKLRSFVSNATSNTLVGYIVSIYNDLKKMENIFIDEIHNKFISKIWEILNSNDIDSFYKDFINTTLINNDIDWDIEAEKFYDAYDPDFPEYSGMDEGEGYVSAMDEADMNVENDESASAAENAAMNVENDESVTNVGDNSNNDNNGNNSNINMEGNLMSGRILYAFPSFFTNLFKKGGGLVDESVTKFVSKNNKITKNMGHNILEAEIYAKSALFIYIVCKINDVFIANEEIDEYMNKVYNIIRNPSSDSDEEQEVLYYVNSMETQLKYSRGLYKLYISLNNPETRSISFPMNVIRKIFDFIGHFQVKKPIGSSPIINTTMKKRNNVRKNARTLKKRLNFLNLEPVLQIAEESGRT